VTQKLYGFPVDYATPTAKVSKITAEDVQRAAQKNTSIRRACKSSRSATSPKSSHRARRLRLIETADAEGNIINPATPAT